MNIVILNGINVDYTKYKINLSKYVKRHWEVVLRETIKLRYHQYNNYLEIEYLFKKF